MRMRVEGTGKGEARVFLEGELNHDTVPEVRKKLLHAARQEGLNRLAVDLSRVDRIDTAGVAVMVEVLQVVTRNGRTLLVEGLAEELKRLFRLARLDEAFRIDGQPEAGA